ncbi:hypothetical protein [Pseudophaeobacter sp.]|uniref:hypothetical protein n=1 Tax=Pseudophaeobacter sp. TaxID=1971739 RepID=UPI003298A364
MSSETGGERSDYAVMAQELSAGSLGPEGFSHRAHLGVAYEMVTRHETFEAMAIYARGLRALTEAAGVPEKYNATVTLGFMSLTAERAATKTYESTAQFLAENDDLLTSGVMAQYFSPEFLGSDLAHRVPLLPRPS